MGKLFHQLIPEVFVPLLLFLFGKMYFPELLRIICVIKGLSLKLLAGQIKGYVSYHVVAVIITVRPQYTVNFSAKYILDAESRDGALAESFVILRPLIPHPRRACLPAPALCEGVVEIMLIVYTFINIIYGRDVRVLPAPEFIFNNIAP